MGLMDLFRISEIKKENEDLKRYIQSLGGDKVTTLKNQLAQLKYEETETRSRKQKLLSQLKTLNAEISKKKTQILSFDETILLESFALYTPHFAFENSDEYKNKLDIIRRTQNEYIKSGHAAKGNINWTVNGKKSEGQKMVKDTIKLVLRSFNNECDYCVDHVKFNNIELNEKRITTSYDAVNRLGRVMDIQISPDYLKLKLDELHLAYEYQVKKQEEKEEQRRIKEEQREQQKLEREIKEAREKIDKEKKHYAKAIEEIQLRLETSTNESEISDLKIKLVKLENTCKELENEEKEIDYREQNAKAGYVYVISNIGAFGENVYKIGMTRRLNPYERIDELGDASVPFKFDVHALIFSDNAPSLEAKIQNHFEKFRLNKINNRREFYKANPDEIESVIKINYDKTLDFVKTPLAEEYRESLKMSA
jgi:hypothetical protein